MSFGLSRNRELVERFVTGHEKVKPQDLQELEDHRTKKPRIADHE
jgi:hypothetical protein